MAKRLSPQQLLELLKSYEGGSTVDELSKKYNFTKLTISRNLKKNLGDNKYKELFELNKSLRPSSKSREINISDRNISSNFGYNKFNNGDEAGNSNNPLHWNTSKVTDMQFLFAHCRKFNQFVGTKEVTIGGETYVSFDTFIGLSSIVTTPVPLTITQTSSLL